MSLTMSGPDIENGPGPQCTWSVSSRGITGTICFTRRSGIVFALAPHDHRQLAAWRERAPDVSQRESRQIEKHRAESRERVIVRTAKIVALRIGAKERNVVWSRFGSFACCQVREILCAIDTYGLAVEGYLCRDEPGRVAKAKTDIEHACTCRIGLPPEQLVTMTGQTEAHDLAKGTEFFEQHGVPSFDWNGVVGLACPEALVVLLAALERRKRDGGGRGLNVHGAYSLLGLMATPGWFPRSRRTRR